MSMHAPENDSGGVYIVDSWHRLYNKLIPSEKQKQKKQSL